MWSFYEAGPEDGDSKVSAPQSGIREEEYEQSAHQSKGSGKQFTLCFPTVSVSVGGPVDFIG